VVRVDGVLAGAAALRLDKGRHTVAVEAAGHVPLDLEVTATRATRLVVRLAHLLPSIAEADLAALPAALPVPSASPPSWDEIDRGVRQIEVSIAAASGAAARQLLWAERTRLDLAEIEVLEAAGVAADDLRARRLVVGARLSSGADAGRTAARELVDLVRHGNDAALTAAASDLAAALSHRRSPVFAYNRVVQLINAQKLHAAATGD
jgi:hypothetical protein